LLSALQKRTAAGIVNVFETGRVLGDYGAVSVLPGDTGHLSYGRSQVTLGSGNLYLMIELYCSTPRAAYLELSSYLLRMQQRDFALDTDMTLRAVLEQAGQDGVMRAVQDQFFDANDWSPAAQSAANFGISSALGTSVGYDSHVQGAWTIVRDLTTAQSGALDVIGENDWIRPYVTVRRDWLANNPNPALHPTVYRMDCFLSLIEDSSWVLALPINIRGVTIDEDTLLGAALARILSLTVPPITGDDVRAVQRALIAAEQISVWTAFSARKRRRRLSNSSNNKVSPPMASLIRPRGPRWGSSPTREKPPWGATLASLECGVLGAR
jgi:chitosanase